MPIAPWPETDELGNILSVDLTFYPRFKITEKDNEGEIISKYVNQFMLYERGLKRECKT